MDTTTTFPVRVIGLRAGRTGEAFVAAPAPQLSWRSETPGLGWTQASAEVELTVDGLVETARLDGPDSVFVPWPFEELQSNRPASVRVRVTGADGSESDWSQPLSIAAPLADFGQHEDFITVPGDLSDAARPHQYRVRFDLPATPVRATLTLTGHGVHEATLNGARVGDEWLAPGWTPYALRLVFRSHDVTRLVSVGNNALGIEAAPGWFGERYGFFNRTHRSYTGPVSVIARLDCELADGSHVTVHTSPDWEGRVGGPVTAASIYHGEDYDARLADYEWAASDSTSWAPCARVEQDQSVLEPATSAPVRLAEVRQPMAVWVTPAGRTMVDFGENCVGVAEITVDGPAGHTVTLRHCEELESGEPAYGPLRTARATDRYTLSGDGPETWHPRFTFHGFRYLELINWPGQPSADSVRLLVLHTDQRRIGTFQCSNPLVNQLFENAVRGWRGNSLAVPTDCPQRDERLGWTGDLQVFVPAACSMFDVDGFLVSWLRDLALEQGAQHGSVPLIVPAVMPGLEEPVAGWGDVATVAPWTLYQRFGDRCVLEDQYPSMVAWVDRVLAHADEDVLWTRGMQIGDHLAPQASDFFPGSNPTDNSLLASAYLCRSLGIMADAAAVLGRAADAAHYASLRDRCRTSILDEYVTPRGRIVSDSITSHAMLIVFGLVHDGTARAMGRRLAELVAEIDFRIGTGFLGTPLVMDALAATGELDTAARLLTQTECPSWLYPVTQGATTIWERWDTKLPDGTVSAEDMASFNHYALGAVTDWLQRGLAGLSAAESGYRTIRIAPVVLPGFNHASTTIDTPYGVATVGWRRSAGRIVVEAAVPPNTSAVVELPDGSRPDAVGSGIHRWECAAPPSHTPTPGAVSMDTSLQILVRDAEAREVIASKLDPFDPGRAHLIRRLVKWAPGLPLHAPLMFADPRGIEAVEDGLAELSKRRDDRGPAVDTGVN